jgi:hypothetical protein
LFVAIRTITPANAGSEYVKVDSQAVITPSGAHACLIGISDTSAHTELKDIWITLYEAQRPRASVGPVNIVPGQAIVVEARPYSPTKCAGPDVFVRVRFEAGSIVEETLSTIAADGPKVADSNSSFVSLAPTVIGILSLVVGAILGHWLSISRDRRNEKMARRSKVYEAEESAIRCFIADWGCLPVAETLRVNFSTLERAIAPNKAILETYRATYKTLTDGSKPLEEKRLAATELERALLSYLEQNNPAR